MKRLAILVCALSAPLLFGCDQKNTAPTGHTEETYSATPSNMNDTNTTTGGSDTSLSGMEGVNPAYYTPPPGGDTRTTSGSTYTSPSQTQTDSSYVPASDESLSPSGSGKTYVVKKGDTLVRISERFYGTKGKWKTIWEANQTRIPNPDRIKVGTKLIIP